MRIDLTLISPSGERDLAVLAPADADAADVRACVSQAARRAGVEPPPDAPIRTGARIPAAPPPAWMSRAELTLDVVGGPDAGASLPLASGRHLVGRGADCALRLTDAGVSRHHLAVTLSGRGVVVAHDGSTNGVAIDGVSVLPGAAAPLAVGGVVRIGDSLLVLRRRSERHPLRTVPGDHAVLVGGSARRAGDRPATVLDEPRRRRGGGRRPAVVGLLLPTVAAAALAWWMHSPQFLVFALLGSAGALVPIVRGGDEPRSPCGRNGPGAHRRRRAAHDARVRDLLRAEAARRWAEAPDAVTVATAAGLVCRPLWQRRIGDDDHLVLRVGFAALPSRLAVRRDGVTRPAGEIAAVPLTASLRAGSLGIVGPAVTARAAGRWLLCQLAVLHPPDELSIAIDAAHDDRWHWARWLPHLRVPARDGAAAVTLVDALDGAPTPGDRGPGFVICLARTPDRLPSRCAQLVRLEEGPGAAATLTSRDGETRFVPDLVTERWADGVARDLAPLRPASSPDLDPAPELLRMLGLPDTGPATLRQTWSAAPDALCAVIGDRTLALDRDGPHVLVAGTTGSGKSVLLRTLVLSLAVCYPPSDVTFLLVDWKGGATFTSCAALPHTAALVTDLDAHTARRALASLDAELRRRERLLSDAGAPDHDRYRRSPAAVAAPLARLVVVIDEFAALADELPGLVPTLAGIARRGRSLGLHLVLATQRPGSAVTAEIRANTGIRIALRTTDAAESAAVVDAPDAARIPAGRPGSGVLRAAGTLATFRTATVARRGPSRVRIEELGPWRTGPSHDADAESGVAELVADVAAAAASAYPPARSPWLPPLPPDLRIDGLAPIDDPSVLPLGLVDLPGEQRQPVWTLDLRTAGVLVCGGPGSGRTTALTSVGRIAALRNSEALELYAVGRTGRLAGELGSLPQLATTLDGDDPSLVLRLLHRLADEPPPTGVHRLVLLDDWDILLSDTPEPVAGDLGAALASLVRAAPGLATTVVVSGDRALLGRGGPPCRERLLLRLDDRADYALAKVPARAVPADPPPGRGVRAADAVEVQLAWFGANPAATSTRTRSATLRRTAVRIRRLPDAVGLADCGPPGALLRLGVAGDEARPLTVDPAVTRHVLVAGPARSGRTTALRTLFAEARRTGRRAVVAAPARSPLHAAAVLSGIAVIEPTDQRDAATALARADLLLMDDWDRFAGTDLDDAVAARLATGRPVAVVAGRADELITAYRGTAAEVRRNRCALLLQPGPLDGELAGVRLPRGTAASRRPGRGVAVGLVPGAAGEPVPAQVALPERGGAPRQLPPMWG